MKFVRKYVQQTVKASSPEEFDFSMNAIFAKAAKGGKEPDVHFFDSLGLCACVRYFVSESVAESLSEKFEIEGNMHLCSECPNFILPYDKRIKKVRCKEGDCLVTASTPCCDIFYERLIMQDEKRDVKV